MTPDAQEFALARLREGQSKGGILAALREKGLDAAGAAKAFQKAKGTWLNETLPATLRAAGRRHLAIGIVLSILALGVCAFAAWFLYGYFASGIESIRSPVPVAIWAVASLALALWELGWARSRFVLARRHEAQRPVTPP